MGKRKKLILKDGQTIKTNLQGWENDRH